MAPLELIQPNWHAPSGVRAVATTRVGGFSQGVYQGLNLGESVGDDPEMVSANRDFLAQTLQLPSPPCWLQQEHTARVIEAQGGLDDVADASYTQQSGVVCVIKTADCLPVLLCSETRPWVAAVHVGWRGAAQNILAHAVTAYSGDPSELQAWFGPAISATRYEVDGEVRRKLGKSLACQAMRPSSRTGHWLLSLTDAARWQLGESGVGRVSQNLRSDTQEPLCTFEEERFYSYRREGVTGRMATLIWMDSQA